MHIICPDCQTKNDVEDTVCKRCSAVLKPTELEKEDVLSPLDNLTSTVPSETSTRGGANWDRNTFINIMAGTELWKQFGCGGVFVVLLILFVIVALSVFLIIVIF